MTDPASENSFWLVLRPGFMVLPYIAYTLRGCAAGQGMVYHLSVPKVYDFVRVCQQGISCTIDLIRWMNFVCSPNTQKQ